MKFYYLSIYSLNIFLISKSIDYSNCQSKRTYAAINRRQLVSEVITIRKSSLDLKNVSQNGIIDDIPDPHKRTTGQPVLRQTRKSFNNIQLNSESFTNRIIGGTVAKPGEWPWIVALNIVNKGEVFFCGGSLITSQYILTAAHCLEGVKGAKHVSVQLGVNSICAQNEKRHSMNCEVEYFRIHPKYNPQNHNNDIAIIKLKSKMRFSKSIQSIDLPEEHTRDTFAGVLATVIGWGTTTFDASGQLSCQLRQVSVPVWTNKNCAKALNMFQISITDGMICAGDINGGKDSCAGDSGGPLMVHTGRKWVIVGVVSFGVDCGLPDTPGVYTRVSKYINWIRRQTNKIL